MRVRRLEAEWVDGKATVDFRGESGSPLPIVGIVGNNGSGKSLLQTLALRLFIHSISSSGRCFLDWDKVSGYVETEYGGTICTGVVKSGNIIQSMVYPKVTLKPSEVVNGFLFYSNDGLYNSNIDLVNGTLVYRVLSDLYKGVVSDSVIWVDSFDVGLDDIGVRDFLKVLIRKSLERNNQLIVSTARRELLSGIGEDSIRQLGSGTNVVERVLKELR